MRIEILCTGDEILTGKTINTNHSFIARRLVENGFRVAHGTVVGDDRARLAAAFETAARRADVVIVNGGLGPTVDDLSQEVAAQAAGVSLELHQPWLERMAAWYRSRGREMPSNNSKQAMLPLGAEFIDNPIGTACGFAVDIGDARFFFTPGVPREMRRMVDEQVLPRLRRMRGGDTYTLLKRFHTFGIGESRADGLLEGVESLAPDGRVKLGFQSHYPQLETKLFAQGSSAGEVEALIAPVANAVRERLQAFLVAEDDESLEGGIMARLSEADQSVALMEMQTDGAIGRRLLGAGEDQQRVLGCMVSHDLAELARMVDALPEEGSLAVSAETAAVLASGLRRRTGADHGLVVLSEVGKRGNAATETRSTIIVAIKGKGDAVIREAVLPGSREWLRLGAGELALDCLRRYLMGGPVHQRIDFEQH